MKRAEGSKGEAIARLTEAYGPPSRTIEKVTAWDHLREGFGVVVQIDSPLGSLDVNIWLPDASLGTQLPVFAVRFAGGKGRHSGTKSAEGLQEGLPALKLEVREPGQLSIALAFIDQQLRAGGPGGPGAL